MKLYHGRYTEIKSIDLKKVKTLQRFWQSVLFDQILRTSENLGESSGGEHKKEGVIVEFEFDEYAYED